MLTSLRSNITGRSRGAERSSAAGRSGNGLRLRDGADAAATDVLRLRVAAGVPGTDIEGLSDRCRRAIEVATAVGAPLLDAVDGAAAAEDDNRRAVRAVRVASAQTRVVAVGLIGAPVVLVPALGRLAGVDLVGFYASGVGLLVLALGVGLLATGAAIVAALVARVGRQASGSSPTTRTRGLFVGAVAAWVAWRAVGPALVPVAALVGQHLASRGRRPDEEPIGTDEAADLAATALAGGVGIPHALRIAADQLPDIAAPLRRLAFELELGLGPSASSERPTPVRGSAFDRMRSVLVTSGEVGAAVAPTLRRLASDLRADDLARVLAAAERLPAQLTFPTALCLLPATVLLIGAPIVHAGLLAAGS